MGGEGVLLRSVPKLVAVLVAVVLVAVSLALVTIGRAGSGSGTMSAFVTPANITSGNTGVAWAKFTPTPSGGNGSATHVQIVITLANAQPNSLHVTSCPGGTAQDGVGVDTNGNRIADPQSASFFISSIQNGVQKKVFVTFRAGASTNGNAVSVGGETAWDQGGGSAGQAQSIPAVPDPTSGTYTIWPTDVTTNVFGGDCVVTSQTNGLNLSATDPNTATGVKGGKLKTNLSAPGFPCTPGYVGVDESVGTIDTSSQGGTPTKGAWSIFVAPLSGTGFAQAVLTIATLPNGAPQPKNMPLFELIGNGPGFIKILQCGADGLPPAVTGAPTDICLVGLPTKFGNKGAQFVVNVVGTGVDPKPVG